jgi:predicted thioesterase
MVLSAIMHAKILNYGVHTMKKDIAGKEFSLTFTVLPEMSASLAGQQIHPVCSTVTMVYFAEVASRKLIEPFFESDDQAIGGGISLQHKAMAAIGEEVEITARITSFEKNIIICDIHACIKGTDIILCNGTQTQILLKKDSINTLIDQAYSRINHKE